MISDHELYEIEIEHLKDYIQKLHKHQNELERTVFNNEKETQTQIIELKSRLEKLEFTYSSICSQGPLASPQFMSKTDSQISGKYAKYRIREPINQTTSNEPTKESELHHQKVYSDQAYSTMNRGVARDTKENGDTLNNLQDVQPTSNRQFFSNLVINDADNIESDTSKNMPHIPNSNIEDPNLNYHHVGRLPYRYNTQKYNERVDSTPSKNESSQRHQNSHRFTDSNSYRTPNRESRHAYQQHHSKRISPIDDDTKSPAEKVTHQIHSLNKSIDYERINKSIANLADLQEDETALKAIDESFERQDRKDAAFEIRSIVDRLDKSILQSELTESEFDKFLRLDAISHKIENFKLPKDFFNSIPNKEL